MNNGKTDCWEFNSCDKKTECPAFHESRTHNVHEGMNGGRSCWMILKSLCNGTEQSTIKDKYRNCSKCDFFHAVQQEHGNRLLSLNQVKKLLT